MSYEVLARRWRPRTFDDVVGQRHVSVTLGNAVMSGRLPHAILLAGPRGVGKTSLARILARSLNCDKGPTEKPCGECRPCIEIANSTSLDVQEIDAASNTGIDDVREIRESIRFSASPGKFRIFIVDEVHMLSKPAFNALLKTLEEPPPQSLFVFATTDPQKIPATVLSRVQRFDLRRLGSTELLALIGEIAAAEEIEIPESVQRALVREADGSARDVLTLLDRLLAGVGNKISEDAASAVLDLVDRKMVRDILAPVLACDAPTAITAVRNALAHGADPSRLAAELLAELRNLLVARIVPDASALIDATHDEVTELAERAREHPPETLQRLFRVLLSRVQDLSFAPRPDHALEMAIVRLATLPDGEALTSLIARLDALEGGGPTTPRGSGPGPARGNSRGDGGGSRRGASERKPTASERKSTVSESKRVAETNSQRQPDPETDARIKREVKTNPTVLEAIEVLDAELRDVRISKTG